MENDRPPDGRERSLPVRARLRRGVPVGSQVKRRTMYDTRRRKQPGISSPLDSGVIIKQRLAVES